jgi:histidine triad (HIT) family protein
MDCIFCRIAKKEIPAEIVYEDELILAFKDIKPVAPVHILIIPKSHIPSVNHLAMEDKTLMGDLILAAQKIAKDRSVDKSGYRLVLNIGQDAGQTVDHLHLHLIGGHRLPWA